MSAVLSSEERQRLEANNISVATVEALLEAGIPMRDARLFARHLFRYSDTGSPSPRDVAVTACVDLTAAGLTSHAVSALASTFSSLEASARLLQAGVDVQVLENVAGYDSIEAVQALIDAGLTVEEVNHIGPITGNSIQFSDLRWFSDDGCPTDALEFIGTLAINPQLISDMRHVGLDWADVLAVLQVVRPGTMPWQAQTSDSGILRDLSPGVRRLAALVALRSHCPVIEAAATAVLADGQSWEPEFRTFLSDASELEPFMAVLSARAMAGDLPRTERPAPQPAPVFPLLAASDARFLPTRNRPVSPALMAAAPAAHPQDLQFLVDAGMDPQFIPDYVTVFEPWIASPESSARPPLALWSRMSVSWLAAVANAGIPADDLLEVSRLTDGVTSYLGVTDAAVALGCGMTVDEALEVAAAGQSVAVTALLRACGWSLADARAHSLDVDPAAVVALAYCGVQPGELADLMPVFSGEGNWQASGWLPSLSDPVPVEVIRAMRRAGITLPQALARSSTAPLADPLVPVHIYELAFNVLVRTRGTLSASLLVAAALDSRPWAQEMLASVDAAGAPTAGRWQLLDAVVEHVSAESSREQASDQSRVVTLQRPPVSEGLGHERE